MATTTSTSQQRHYSTSSDNRSVHSTGTSATRRSIVFVTPAKYTPFVCCLVAMPIFAVLVCMVVLHPKDYRNSSTTWILGWTLLLVMVLYMAILPKQIDVRSTGTVGIKTFLLTFHIDDVVRAYQAGLGREEFLRPRVRFVTSLQDRVVLRRNHGKWDVVVSPQDLDGFLKAVEEMVREHGGDGENGGAPYDDCAAGCADDLENNIIIVPAAKRQQDAGKPDLASTDYARPHRII